MLNGVGSNGVIAAGRNDGLTRWKREVRGNAKMRTSLWMLTRIG